MYEHFLNWPKTAQSDVYLTLTESKEAYAGNTRIVALVAECAFQAEVSTRPSAPYRLRIFTPFFGDCPCFRFEAKGASHTNREDGSGLPSRSVPTPHFHKVSSDGYLRAYQTSELADPRGADDIANDVVLGTEEFCAELKLVGQSGGGIVLKNAFVQYTIPTGILDSASLPQ